MGRRWDLDVDIDPIKTETENRRCVLCGNKLSIYNHNNYCFSCKINRVVSDRNYLFSEYVCHNDVVGINPDGSLLFFGVARVKDNLRAKMSKLRGHAVCKYGRDHTLLEIYDSMTIAAQVNKIGRFVLRQCVVGIISPEEFMRRRKINFYFGYPK